jgi:hypothetical protein
MGDSPAGKNMKERELVQESHYNLDNEGTS